MICIECNTENRPTAKFCVECGNSFNLNETCDNCGKQNRSGSRFCIGCGSRIWLKTEFKNDTYSTDKFKSLIFEYDKRFPQLKVWISSATLVVILTFIVININLEEIYKAINKRIPESLIHSTPPTPSEAQPQISIQNEQGNENNLPNAGAATKDEFGVDAPTGQFKSGNKEKLGEIVSREHSDIIGDYYVVKINPVGFSPIKVEIRAQTAEEALAKIIKKDDFILVRDYYNNAESAYLARYGKIFSLPVGVFSVEKNSAVGVSYQNGRLGPETASISLSGYGGLNGQTIEVTAKRFFIIQDNAAITDTDYTWNFSSNREIYDRSSKIFEASISEMGSAKKEFDPNDPIQWNKIMIPAAQALLVAKISAKETLMQSIYEKLADKFGDDTVDFLKGKISTLQTDNRKITGLAEAAVQDQDKIRKKEEELRSVKLTKDQMASDTKFKSVIGKWICDSYNPNGSVTKELMEFEDNTYFGKQDDGSLFGTYEIKENVINVTVTQITTGTMSMQTNNGFTLIIRQGDENKFNGETVMRRSGNKRTISCSRVLNTQPNAVSNPDSAISNQHQYQADSIYLYADSLAKQLEMSSFPPCRVYATYIRQFASSSSPDYVKQRQIDAVFDKVPDICF